MVANPRSLLFFNYFILCFAAIGVVVNISAFIFISRKKKSGRSAAMFHDLLKLLMGFDVLVVLCILLQFALNPLWEAYTTFIHPYIQPWLFPIMQISVMSSVYCTILISFERYIRICYFCQLRSTRLLTESNVKYYKLFVLIFPIVFYIPKFFEVRVKDSETVDCMKSFKFQKLMSMPKTRAIIELKFSNDSARLLLMQELADRCFEHNYEWVNASSGDAQKNRSLSPTGAEEQEQQQQPTRFLRLRNEAGIVNYVRKLDRLELDATAFRKNKYYYRIYYVFLNTLFASVLPLGLLLFLNIRTAQELFKMGKMESAAATATAPRMPLVTTPSPQPVPLAQQQQQQQPAAATLLSEAVPASKTPSPCPTVVFTPPEQQPLATENGRTSVEVPPQPLLLEQLETQPDEYILTQDQDQDQDMKSSRNKKFSLLSALGIHRLFFSHRGSASTENFAARRTSSLNGSRFRQSLFRKRKSSASSVFEPVNRNKEKRLAYISLYIVWLFIFSHVWKLVPTIYEAAMCTDDVGLVIYWPDWLVVIEKISHTLITANSSLNFFVYLVI